MAFRILNLANRITNARRTSEVLRPVKMLFQSEYTDTLRAFVRTGLSEACQDNGYCNPLDGGPALFMRSWDERMAFSTVVEIQYPLDRPCPMLMHTLVQVRVHMPTGQVKVTLPDMNDEFETEIANLDQALAYAALYLRTWRPSEEQRAIAA